MKSILTIDQGNSRVKLKLYVCGREAKSVVAESLTAHAIAEVSDGRRIDGAIYSSVGKKDAGVEEILQSHCEKILVLTEMTPMPIAIEYSSRPTLGLDRIAAAVGGLRVCPDKRMVIADAGTALTVDVADGGRGFIGGNISAGVRMRLDALHHYTARLPNVSTQGAVPLAGYDTDTALRSGAIRGVAAEIAVMAETTDAEVIILTGGDGPLVERYVKEITGIRTEVVSDLVSIGLLRIYEYNENKL